MTKKAKKPIECELTIKDLKSVVGGSIALTAQARHKMQHNHPSNDRKLLKATLF